MARAINRITAVLAGGIQQHVTWGLAEFGWVWLYAPSSPEVRSWGVSPRCHCGLGKLTSTAVGEDAPESDFGGVKWMIDSSAAGKRERGRNSTASRGWEPQSGRRGERLPFTEEQRDFPFSLFSSKTWNTKSTLDLCFYRSLRSGHWNKSSWGALGGMLCTEFMNKVRPVSPPVLVRCWKYRCVHAKNAGAKLHGCVHI